MIFLGSRYREKLAEDSVFEQCLVKWCLPKCALVVFGGLDPFSVEYLIVIILKGAEHSDWMASRHACYHGEGFLDAFLCVGSPNPCCCVALHCV